MTNQQLVSEPRAGSDRIIFHFSFSIYHWPFGGFISHRSNNEQMKNAKWKMTNDPVATARGSVTTDLSCGWFAFRRLALSPLKPFLHSFEIQIHNRC